MTAFEDPKIQKAIGLLGYEGYAYYFILLELLAKQCENGFKNPITLHQQTVRIVLRKSQQSCNKVVTKLQESGLFVVTFKENLYEFYVPNLSKYLGKYENKMSPNSPNKIKENKIKEKESIKERVTCDDVLNLWNDSYGNKFGYCPGFGSGKHLENVLESLGFLKTIDDWKNLFLKATESNFLSGKNNNDWTVNLLWLIDYDNALKVLSDTYNENKIIKNLFAGIGE